MKSCWERVLRTLIKHVWYILLGWTPLRTLTIHYIIVDQECILELLKFWFSLYPRLSYLIIIGVFFFSFFPPKAHCQIMDESVICEGSLFWEKGFVAFQAAINAAIIEVSIEFKETNCFENLVFIEGDWINLSFN